jgi:hypothetical protein
MSNPSLSRPSLFRDGHLSLGVTLPIREKGTCCRLHAAVELATAAEQLGFCAVWVRDVPLNGPCYPEAFGHPDPMVMLGAIASSTSRIALGTAATVLTLRHPPLPRQPFRSIISAMGASCWGSGPAIGAKNSQRSATNPRITRSFIAITGRNWPQPRDPTLGVKLIRLVVVLTRSRPGGFGSQDPESCPACFSIIRRPSSAIRTRAARSLCPDGQNC